MPLLLIYNSSDEIPREPESQIRTVLLDEWPRPYVDDTGGLLIEPQLHPTYFILADANSEIESNYE